MQDARSFKVSYTNISNVLHPQPSVHQPLFWIKEKNKKKWKMKYYLEVLRNVNDIHIYEFKYSSELSKNIAYQMLKRI